MVKYSYNNMHQNQNQNNHRKVVLVGPTRMGKTRFVDMVMATIHNTYSEESDPLNEFDDKIKNSITSSMGHTPTLGVEVKYFHPYNVNLWDTAGDPRFGGLREGYWLSANYFLIFVDTDEEEHQWKEKILPYSNNYKVIRNGLTISTHEAIDIMGNI